ncbi:hypothetical protein Vadar_004101 [Vaccinium darrowii]|uniref:Uncharacterized protein n=1 Tax=Vaccinium darrowii TaxID=229202 RepID=A0ACB7YUT1_9ERIC|nr:hypothetical protein Vadar_004101 [Vaccinium darrowii]
MLNGEDQQLSKGLPSDHTTVLVATTEKNTSQGGMNSTGGVSTASIQTGMSHLGLVSPSNSGGGVSGQQNQLVHMPVQSQFVPQQQFVSQQFAPQQQFYQNQNRNNTRGRGSRRFFKDPCEICGRNNHTTNFCYYKSQTGGFDSQYGAQFGGFSASQPYPQASSWGNPAINYITTQMMPQPMQPMMQPMLQPPSQPVQAIMQPSPIFHQFRPQMSTSQVSQSSAPQFHRPENNFGRTTSYSQNSGVTPFAGFTAAYQMPAMIPSSSGTNFGGSDQPIGMYGGYSSMESNPPQHWYVDSGATHHITNNLNNITQPHPAAQTEGVLVVNGSNLPVAHSGQVYS